MYWYKYRDKEDVPDMDIPVELCLEILMAADYFGLDSKRALESLPRDSQSNPSCRPNVSIAQLGRELIAAPGCD